VPELAVYLIIVSYRAMLFVLVLDVVMVAGTRAMGLPPGGFLDAAAALILVTPLGFALYFVLVRLFGLSQRINYAIAWARWEEVLRLIDRVPGRGPTFESHAIRAQALAGLGRLADALREFDQVTDLPGIPESLYWMHQALVYQAAGGREKVVQVQERAHEVAPTASGVIIIYAHNLAIIRGDFGGARRLLAGLRGHAVSDIAAPCLHSLEGELALKEGRPQEAVAHLTRGYTLIRRFARGNIVHLPQAARIRARLALALAAAGDTAAARRHFLRARPVLVAHRENDFVRQCEQAVG
jgi:tetratricopeptide (TPR) repeat protein